MSSSVYITLDNPVNIDRWAQICEKYRIVYSPQTIGGRTFYYGGHGCVEITIGDYSSVEKLPEYFSKITVSSFYMKNLEAIAEVVHCIIAELNGTINAASELEHLLVDLPSTYLPGDDYDAEDLEVTDFPEGWQALGVTSLSARVSAGQATIYRSDGLYRLEIDGIKRASFWRLQQAMAFAGRCDWRFWCGEKSFGELLASR